MATEISRGYCERNRRLISQRCRNWIWWLKILCLRFMIRIRNRQEHSDAESIAISTHLKRTLEGVVEEIFGKARIAAGTSSDEEIASSVD